MNKKIFSNLISEINYNKPISYGKSRVSGSINKTYYMHCKSACMPGQKELFTVTSLTKNKYEFEGIRERVSSSFARESYIKSKQSFGPKYNKGNQESFTYQEFCPYDDTSLEIAILSSYRQVYGNLRPMNSERPIDLERRLRNGDIPISEFVRELAKSPFYKKHFFELLSQESSIHINFLHILGRPLRNQNELIKHILILNSNGYDAHIDSLIDSLEYQETFGENIVPYKRAWNSPCNMPVSSFVETAHKTKGYASSDNVIMGNKLKCQ